MNIATNNIVLQSEINKLDTNLNKAELNERSFIYSKIIKSYLPQANNHIAIISDNSIDIPILFEATLKTNNIFIPFNTNYPEQLLNQLIVASNIKLIFISEKYKNKINTDLPILIIEQLLNTDFIDTNIKTKTIQDKNNLKYDVIIFSSGSASQLPKAIAHSYQAMVNSANNSATNISLKQSDKWLVCLPFYHIGGLAIYVRTSLANACCVIQDKNISLIENIIKYSITHISLVASQLNDLLSDANNIKYLQKLDAILLGGSAISNTLIEQAFNYGLNIFTSYGSSETGSQVCASTPNASLSQLKLSGKALADNQIKIDENDEILIKTNALFLGYYTYANSDNKLDMSSIDTDGWFHSNDRGKIHNDDYLEVFGRLDNMIISGGENIQLETIEKILTNCSFISQALVLAMTDNKWGQRPVAFIKRENNFEINNFIDYLNTNLEKYSIPDFFYEWVDNPNQVSIKIDKSFYYNLIQLNECSVIYTKNKKA